MASLRAMALGVWLLACGPAAPTWSDRAMAPEARLEGFAATVDGKLYYLGGITGIDGVMESAQPSARVDVLDLRTGQWSVGPPLPAESAKHHLAVAVHRGALYVLGGFDGIIGRGIAGDAFRPIATSYVLEGDRWRRLADAPVARGGATAQSIGDAIYVAGGTRNEGVDPYGDLFAYDPAMDRWARRAPLPHAREHVASCVIDGKMLVLGGWVGAARTAQNAAELYDPAMDQWSILPAMPTARGGLGAAAIDGRCHAIGGEDWALPLPGTFASHEVYDPLSSRWITAAPMGLARHGSGVTAIEGALWVLGGGPQQGNSYTARIEVFR